MYLTLHFRAKKDFEENLATCHDFQDFCNALDKKKVILAPFCGAIPCEEKIKKLSARSVRQKIML